MESAGPTRRGRQRRQRQRRRRVCPISVVDTRDAGYLVCNPIIFTHDGWLNLNLSTPTRLYLYSGLPLLINYRDFKVACPCAPPLFASLVSLSEVLRFKIRPSSLCNRVPAATPYSALQEWQSLHLPIDSLFIGPLSPATPGGKEKSLSAEAIVRLCHGAVLALFVLDLGHADLPPQHAEQHLLAALHSNLGFPGVFQKIKLLERLGMICALGLLRLSKLHGAPQGGMVLAAWGRIAGTETMQRLVTLADDQSMGWEVVWRVGE